MKRHRWAQSDIRLGNAHGVISTGTVLEGPTPRLRAADAAPEEQLRREHQQSTFIVH